jgi:hypothetical protein
MTKRKRNEKAGYQQLSLAWHGSKRERDKQTNKQKALRTRLSFIIHQRIKQCKHAS